MPDLDLPPHRPDPPEAGDCCGGGCVSCVFDAYDAALERYEAALVAWRAHHPDEHSED